MCTITGDCFQITAPLRLQTSTYVPSTAKNISANYIIFVILPFSLVPLPLFKNASLLYAGLILGIEINCMKLWFFTFHKFLDYALHWWKEKTRSARLQRVCFKHVHTIINKFVLNIVNSLSIGCPFYYHNHDLDIEKNDNNCFVLWSIHKRIFFNWGR